MRLNEIVLETWDSVSTFLNALLEMTNTDLEWLAEASGRPISRPQVNEQCMICPESSQSTPETRKRQRYPDKSSDKNPDKSNEPSQVPPDDMQVSKTLNAIQDSVADITQSVLPQDKKQVKRVLKGRTRHKAKELLHIPDKKVELPCDEQKITSPTTKVVNLASKADESRLNSDIRLQSTVSSSLDILRKGLMQKMIAPEQNYSIVVQSAKRILDSCGDSVSSIENTSFGRSSNPEISDAALKNTNLSGNSALEIPSINRESVALDRLSKVPHVSQLKSILKESDSLEKDRKIVLEGLQDAQLKSLEKENLDNENIRDLNESRKILQKSSIPQIPILKEKSFTPIVKPVETVTPIQNTILDILEDPAPKSPQKYSNSILGESSCILDENGNLPDIQSDDESEDEKLHRPKIAKWAHTPHLKGALETQKSRDPDTIFGAIPPIQLEDVFKDVPKKKFMRPRASSGVWDSLTPDEISMYKIRMGFKKE